MKLGIIGLPQTGKKSIFGLLTGSKIPLNSIEAQKAVSGTADIRDMRFNELIKIYNPNKEAPARIDIQLLPKIDPNIIKEGVIFKDIADMDAICHIIRSFEDDSVYHINGSVNPERDIDAINSELILHDLLFIEKRLERMEKDSKKKNVKDIKSEESLLLKFRSHLENDNHLRTLKITEEEEKLILSYPFITRKKMLIVLNVNDDKINNSDLVQKLSKKYTAIDIDIMQVSAKLELEIASLENEIERKEFMDAVGIAEPALHILSRLAMKSLGLISFFTVGKDEVKQWLIKNESSAPVAAGAIHSDIERGFIRAEVMKYNDLIELGSEDKVKKAGKFYTMGKDYIVQDGDIINFRFNV